MPKFLLFLYNIYSLFFCLRHLPFKVALKIPILIHPSAKVRIDKKSSIVFPGKIWRSMFSFGFDSTEGRSNCRSMLSLRNGGQLVIRGLTIIAKGSRLIVDGGIIDIGNNFFCNGDCWFNCTTVIKIGKDNMYGWNINFNTSDGHLFYVDRKSKSMEAEIHIGNHVWIASYAYIAKGVCIGSDSVVAQCSLVNGQYIDGHCLIGGVPARVLKRNVDWAEK